jgi:trans-aconitate methyltransferase
MMQEWQWWNELDGEERLRNAWGWPHYDVDEVARFIEEYTFIADDVLDIGCGPGRLGHALARRNPWAKFHGIDVSPNMVEHSLTDAPKNWTAETNDGRTLPEGPYSTVYAVTVFQHLPHDVVAQYVIQAHDRLKPGGRLIFTYAVGTEQTERSYQASHDLAFEWCADFEFKNRCPKPDTHPDWNWMVAQK